MGSLCVVFAGLWRILNSSFRCGLYGFIRFYELLSSDYLCFSVSVYISVSVFCMSLCLYMSVQMKKESCLRFC